MHACVLLCSALLAAKPGPVQVYILAGQSNMEGQGIIAADPKRNAGQGSLEWLVAQPTTPAYIRELRGADGQWRVRDDVFISYLERQGPLTVSYGARPTQIGPELGFGQVVGDWSTAPVLLIKCAWGGKSLAVDFRPPSAGPAPEAFKVKDPATVGHYYREILRLTQTALAHLGELVPGGKDYVLAGFAWHQGWNDRVTQPYNDEYERNLAHLIRDLRRDLKAPALPFVLAETGMTGFAEVHPRAVSLMKAQAAVADYPEFRGNVACVGTRAYWRPAEQSPSGQGFHWNTNAETYYLIGTGLGHAMTELLGTAGYQTRNVEGWRLHIKDALLAPERAAATEAAVKLLQAQLAELPKQLPPSALARLREVGLWFSPEYPGIGPRAEYHPGVAWLRAHGRNPSMAQGVEFTNVRIFAAECDRMPVFALHELAHAYHDRVLGNERADLLAAYERAKASKLYDEVECRHGTGRPVTRQRHYALTNVQEFFAESTEAYFGRNDFFPFTRDELKQHDPATAELLGKLWGLP